MNESDSSLLGPRLPPTYRRSLSSFPTPCLQSIKEVKDPSPQCGKTLGLIHLRQLCLQKFKPECCLQCMGLSTNLEHKVLQIHGVISLELIKSAFRCSPCLFLMGPDFQFWSVSVTLTRSPAEDSRTYNLRERYSV